MSTPNQLRRIVALVIQLGLRAFLALWVTALLSFFLWNVLHEDPLLLLTAAGIVLAIMVLVFGLVWLWMWADEVLNKKQ